MRNTTNAESFDHFDLEAVLRIQYNSRMVPYPEIWGAAWVQYCKAITTNSVLISLWVIEWRLRWTELASTILIFIHLTVDGAGLFLRM